MMRMFLVLVLALLPGLARAAADGKDAVAVLAAAKSLRCVFGSAVETSWEVGSYQTRPRPGFSYTIERIDRARGNAKAVSPQGATHLEMIALSNVRHFLGFTAGGDLNVTSVFSQFGRENDQLLASHSVHMASEPPRTLQHFGYCKAVSAEK